MVCRVELLDPLGRIFLERQRPIVVDVELVEVAAAGGEILVRLDLAILVVVVAAETLLGAALLARFGCLQRVAAAEQRGASCRRCIGKRRRMRRVRLPQEEGAGHQQETGGDPGKETQHGKSPSNEEIRHVGTLRNGAVPVNYRGKLPHKRCRAAAESRLSPLPSRTRSAAASAASTVSTRKRPGIGCRTNGSTAAARFLSMSRAAGSLQ